MMIIEWWLIIENNVACDIKWISHNHFNNNEPLRKTFTLNILIIGQFTTNPLKNRNRFYNIIFNLSIIIQFENTENMENS